MKNWKIDGGEKKKFTSTFVLLKLPAYARFVRNALESILLRYNTHVHYSLYIYSYVYTHTNVLMASNNNNSTDVYVIRLLKSVAFKFNNVHEKKKRAKRFIENYTRKKRNGKTYKFIYIYAIKTQWIYDLRNEECTRRKIENQIVFFLLLLFSFNKTNEKKKRGIRSKESFDNIVYNSCCLSSNSEDFFFSFPSIEISMMVWRDSIYFLTAR